MEELTKNILLYTDQTKAQKLKSAVELYKKGLAVYPDYLIANKSLGSIYSGYYNDFKSAEKYYFNALKTEKDNAEILLSLGYLYQKNSKPDEAEKYYRKALASEPDNINACSLLANIYFLKGKEDTAMYYNNMIMNIDSLSDLPHINLGNYFLSLQDTVKAVECWEKAIYKVPSNPNLLYGLHRYFLQKNNRGKSEYYMKLYNHYNK
jgi:tetratricopeptide (TPR) repeat protein